MSALMDLAKDVAFFFAGVGVTVTWYRIRGFQVEVKR